MKPTTTGLFWFSNDLRLHDNPALFQASRRADQLLCVYVIDRQWQTSSLYPMSQVGSAQDDFLSQSLQDLNQQLQHLGQRLLVLESDTYSAIDHLVTMLDVTDVFRSDMVGVYENQAWWKLIAQNDNVNFHSIDTHTLFDQDSLPFSVEDLPGSFTKFKHAVADISVLKPVQRPTELPPMPSLSFPDFSAETDSNSNFVGGERAGLAQLSDYFSSEKPMFYKEVRNAIDGWDNSCKFSPWLANGSLSVRETISALNTYENTITANESTYWIYFELLWREYFQWYAQKFAAQMFAFAGINDRKPLTSFYPERLQRWIGGTTPYPLVNACMNELRETGYLSNRGRQIVASCLINELSLDWRYGAAYFEQVLIDYDVASNWGNWQYLAGVGADTRPRRHFNLDKQTQQFDPQRRYIDAWQGAAGQHSLDSLDAAAWPIDPGKPSTHRPTGG